MCWQSPGQEGGLCVVFFSSPFSFKKRALFKIGLTLFSVACRKLAIMVSSGFATDYVNLQQINYLLAHDCTRNTLWNGITVEPCQFLLLHFVTLVVMFIRLSSKVMTWAFKLQLPAGLVVGIADGGDLILRCTYICETHIKNNCKLRLSKWPSCVLLDCVLFLFYCWFIQSLVL